MAKKKRDPERKKRSLLSSLFEPADAPETDGLFDEPAPEDDAELVHLFDDDDVEYSDEQDEAVLSDLTWNDGEHVVEDVSSLTRQADAARRKRRADRDEPQEDRPAARRKKGRRRQHAAAAGSPHSVTLQHPAVEGEPLLHAAAPGIGPRLLRARQKRRGREYGGCGGDGEGAGKGLFRHISSVPAARKC